MSDQVRARARVTVTLEFDTGSVYGGDWTVEKIQEQASRESVSRLRNELRFPGGICILGRPTVEVLMVRES